MDVGLTEYIGLHSSVVHGVGVSTECVLYRMCSLQNVFSDGVYRSALLCCARSGSQMLYERTCIHTRIHTYTHTHIHTYTHTHIHTLALVKHARSLALAPCRACTHKVVYTWRKDTYSRTCIHRAGATPKKKQNTCARWRRCPQREREREREREEREI